MSELLQENILAITSLKEELEDKCEVLEEEYDAMKKRELMAMEKVRLTEARSRDFNEKLFGT